jgi:hypothetical protein
METTQYLEIIGEGPGGDARTIAARRAAGELRVHPESRHLLAELTLALGEIRLSGAAGAEGTLRRCNGDRRDK